MRRLRWALIAALLCLLVAGAFDVPVSVAAPQNASDGAGTGGASARVLPLAGTAGAITALAILALPQSGQDSRPRSLCVS